MLIVLEGFSYAQAARILKISRTVLIRRLACARAALSEIPASETPSRPAKARPPICAWSNESVMPGDGPPVSEAELLGFVDGNIDRGRREAVEAFLAASPEDCGPGPNMAAAE